MDLKRYYAELREMEATMQGPHVLMMSLDTEDGGKAGVITEVPTFEAAVMVKQKRARLLSSEEQSEYREAQEARRALDEERRIAERVHVTVVAAQKPSRANRTHED